MLVIVVFLVAGPGEDPPDDGCEGGGGVAQRADQGAVREECAAGERKRHPEGPERERLRGAERETGID